MTQQRSAWRSPARASAPTGWAIKERARADSSIVSACICGADLVPCDGCGDPRCLACDPYLSDDCRWKL